MRAIIVEDEEIDRLNLKTLLEDHPDVEIAGEADSLESAAALIERETLEEHELNAVFAPMGVIRS